MIHPTPSERVAPVTLDYASARRRKHVGLTPTSVGALVTAAVFIFVAVPIAMVAVPSLVSAGGGDRIDLNRGKLGALKVPIELYRQHMGTYPTSLNDLVTAPASRASAARWAGPYITNLDDLKDRWDRPFRYQAPGTANLKEYDVWSVGSDGEDGTSDDIGNWRR